MVFFPLLRLSLFVLRHSEARTRRRQQPINALKFEGLRANTTEQIPGGGIFQKKKKDSFFYLRCYSRLSFSVEYFACNKRIIIFLHRISFRETRGEEKKKEETRRSGFDKNLLISFSPRPDHHATGILLYLITSVVLSPSQRVFGFCFEQQFFPLVSLYP